VVHTQLFVDFAPILTFYPHGDKFWVMTERGVLSQVGYKRLR